jgi:hypothetical protein
MLELVRWQFCTMGDDGGGEPSVDDEPTAPTSLHRYLDHWGSEHHEMYLRVRQTFLEYAAGLQSVFDRVIDGMLAQEQSEERREAEAEGKSEDEGKERSEDNATKRPAAGRREQLVRTSLRVMSADEKRWFAQEVARVCGEPDEETALRYRALLFEMKKESCASARELMARSTSSSSRTSSLASRTTRSSLSDLELKKKKKKIERNGVWGFEESVP